MYIYLRVCFKCLRRDLLSYVLVGVNGYEHDQDWKLALSIPRTASTIQFIVDP